MNRFNIVFLRTSGHSRRMRMLVSLVPLTDTREAQPRSGLEHLHFRKHRHNNTNNSTYLITLTITIAVVSPRVVMHCLNSSTLLGSEEKKQKNDQNKRSAKPRMASIYEKPPLFKLQKTWNEKTILPEVY